MPGRRRRDGGVWLTKGGGSCARSTRLYRSGFFFLYSIFVTEGVLRLTLTWDVITFLGHRTDRGNCWPETIFESFEWQNQAVFGHWMLPRCHIYISGKCKKLKNRARGQCVDDTTMLINTNSDFSQNI